MFKNYLYVSGTTDTGRQYFRDFYDIVLKYVNKDKCNNVLDIACNDGSQLEVFKSHDHNTYGIDPAKNLYDISRAKGFTSIVCGYFNNETACKFDTKMDVIIAQNVFAHLDDIHGFLESCKAISHKDTKIFIQTSQADMFVNGEFDTIYHEHLSFFNINSMNTCARRRDLHLQDVLRTSIHGNSYVFVISTTAVDQTRIQEMIDEESRAGKMSLALYETFATKAIAAVNDLKNCIISHKQKGYTVVGYGAAAKANTLLNFGDIHLDFIVDDNELKQGLLTPGTDILIRAPDSLRTDTKMLIVPLAWNFYKEIKARVQKERQNEDDVFVRYFPTLSYE
jgi:hypothetical protein